MRFKRDFKRILLKAWSVRFIAAAVVCSSAEVALPLFSEEMPRGLFAALSGLATVGALVSRVMVQNDLDKV